MARIFLCFVSLFFAVGVSAKNANAIWYVFQPSAHSVFSDENIAVVCHIESRLRTPKTRLQASSFIPEQTPPYPVLWISIINKTSERVYIDLGDCYVMRNQDALAFLDIPEVIPQNWWKDAEAYNEGVSILDAPKVVAIEPNGSVILTDLFLFTPGVESAMDNLIRFKKFFGQQACLSNVFSNVDEDTVFEYDEMQTLFTIGCGISYSKKEDLSDKQIVCPTYYVSRLYGYWMNISGLGLNKMVVGLNAKRELIANQCRESNLEDFEIIYMWAR